MPFVVDASVASCRAFDHEAHPVAARALEHLRVNTALVPALWWFEVRNVLIVNERRKRIARTGVSAFLRNLSRLSIVIDRSPDETPLLELARQTGCRLMPPPISSLQNAQGCRLRRSTANLLKPPARKKSR